MLIVTYKPSILSVIMLIVIILSVIILSVIMLNIIMLSVIILNVVAPITNQNGSQSIMSEEKR
jgi:hypothetical protein